jgi:hypothetical protein
LTTSTPLSCLKSAATGCAARSISAWPAPSACNTCAAAGSMRASCSGKNSILLTAPLPAGALKLSLMRLASMVAATFSSGAWPGTSARAAAN